MKLHEKTLELMITHELLNLASSIAADYPIPYFLHPYRLRREILRLGRIYASGLHINYEGLAGKGGGNGVDVQIGARGLGYVAYLQFKRGEESVNSLPSQANFQHVNQVIKFKINTKKSNQHFMLLDLANSQNGYGNNVLYVLPNIARMDEIVDSDESLFSRTRFFPVKQLHQEANDRIVRDSTHSLYMNRMDMFETVLLSEPVPIDGADANGDFMADIAAIAFHKSLLVMEQMGYWREGAKDFINYAALGLAYRFSRYLHASLGEDFLRFIGEQFDDKVSLETHGNSHRREMITIEKRLLVSAVMALEKVEKREGITALRPKTKVFRPAAENDLKKVDNTQSKLPRKLIKIVL